GSLAHPGSEYVELQMWAAGQNLVGGHTIGVYGSGGVPLGAVTFAHDVSGDADQSTLVAATPEAESEFGFSADASLAPGLLNPGGGAVCWESLDCVAWGNFSGAAKSPVGQPAAAGGIPDGMALRRTIEPGCGTLLEPGDDRDNSAADFSSVFPAPRPNSVAPFEHACAPPAGAGGNAHPGGGAIGTAGGSERPQTRIRRSPGHRTRDRTPTFRFASSVPGSTFRCRLDATAFRSCPSPFTVPRLRLGHHVFEVEARTPDGTSDRSPAAYGFAVIIHCGRSTTAKRCPSGR
ncbi:MAG TPA: hypothetical protein VLK56_00920, partial [Solirubrobacterales bacterium]|nr:hypothetical protein [Solirubrobacterales bacterium]